METWNEETGEVIEYGSRVNRVFRTNYNKPFLKVDEGEKNLKPSLTIPDQSLSVKQIMERYARGLSVTDAKVPMWYGEELDLPDLKRLDMSEIEQLKESNKILIRNLREQNAQKAINAGKEPENMEDVPKPLEKPSPKPERPESGERP